ncbi:MAG: hypothetical protein KJZ59_01470 [Pararhodobacter sp.]|nr:hypothetical protein [Pararhodobacter sp.]
MTAAAEDYRSRITQISYRNQAFIDGKYVPARSGKTFDCVSPIDGAVLTQVAECRTEQLLCWAYDNASFLTVRVISARMLELRTDDFVIADFGESMMASNLAETIGRESVYTLFRLNDGPCPVE